MNGALADSIEIRGRYISRDLTYRGFKEMKQKNESFKTFPTPVHFSSSATRQVPPDSPLGTGREIVGAEGRVKEGSMKTRCGKGRLTYLRPHEDGWRGKLLPCRLSFHRLARRRESSEGRIFHLLLRVQIILLPLRHSVGDRLRWGTSLCSPLQFFSLHQNTSLACQGAK